MRNSRTALVTGASSGIGRELARVLAQEGYSLVIVARRNDRLQMLAKELNVKHGTTVRILVEDLLDPAAPDRIAVALERDGVHIDVLVNDAGLGAFGPFAGVPLDSLQRMVQVNI